MVKTVMWKQTARSFLAACLLGFSFAAMAADITVHDVYEAAQAGHMQQAQAMMQQVLREHPDSPKAHYVEAELYAKSDQLDEARRELKTAERIDPTLSFAKPAALSALQARLAVSSPSGFASRSGFSWGYAFLAVGLILMIGLCLRALLRRNTAAPVAPFASAVPPPSYGPGYGPGYGGGYGPGAGAMGGGMGSGIMGGLATGAAVGAGLVAGEALASHFVEGHSQSAAAPPEREWQDHANPNDNMGGNDFGVDDSASWDSGDAGGGDFGGGDWS